MPRTKTKTETVQINPEVPYREIPVRSDEALVHSRVSAVSWVARDWEQREESRGVAIRITHVRRRGQYLTRRQFHGVSMSITEAEAVYAQLGAAIARAKKAQ
jgi:hypothetical protein